MGLLAAAWLASNVLRPETPPDRSSARLTPARPTTGADETAALTVESPRVSLLRPSEPAPLPDATSTDARRTANPAAADDEGLLRIRITMDGKPVDGARVEVWPTAADAGFDSVEGLARSRSDRNRSEWPDPRPMRQPPATVATADASGRCDLLLSRRAVFVASARRDQDTELTSGLWFASQLHDEERGADGLEVALQPTHPMTGSVAWCDGRPAEDVEVRFSETLWTPGGRSNGVPRRPQNVRTDGRGGFRALIDNGYFGNVCAVTETLQTPDYFCMFFVSPAELRFPGRFFVRGSVVDEEGRGLSGVKLKLDRRLTPVCEVTSDRDGRFEAALVAAGSYAVAVSPSGMWPAKVMATIETATVTDGAPVAEIVVRLVTGASIHGTVSWADGTPVEGATLTAIPQVEQRLSVIQRTAIDGQEDNTDDDGAFTLHELCPGTTYAVKCSLRPSEASYTTRDVVPESGELRIVLPLLWRTGATLDVVVVDASTGEPVDDSNVQLCRTSDSLWPSAGTRPRRLLPMSKRLEVHREGPGRFRFEQIPLGAPYGVTAKASGYAMAEAGPYDLKSGPEQIRIALRPCTSLRVAVRDAAGAPVPSARVLLLEPDSAPMATKFSLRNAVSTTDASGIASFADLPPGPSTVQAFAGSLHSEAALVTPGPGDAGWLVLTLQETEATGGLEVTVMDGTGHPMPGADVSVSWLEPDSDGQGVQTRTKLDGRTSSDGRARFEALPPGIYSAACMDLDRGLGSSPCAVEAGKLTSVQIDTN